MPGAGFHRVLNERYSVLLGPTPHFTSVQRLRLENVEADVAEIRALVAEHDHRGTVWWIGASTTPPDLYERLLELGAEVPRDRVSELTAMASGVEPEPSPVGVEARPVASFEEFAAGSAIQWEAFGTPPERRSPETEGLRAIWEDMSPDVVPFLAFVEGRAAGYALGVYCPRGCLLVGGSTLPDARGRGAYRALVRARWDEAVRRGTPALVTQAAPTSEPILRRLGFQAVCRLRRLEDPE